MAQHSTAQHSTKSKLLLGTLASIFLIFLLSGCVDSESSGQEAYYTAEGLLVAPGRMQALYAPVEDENTVRVNIPAPAEAYLDKDPAERIDPIYSNRLTFSPIQYVAKGARDLTETTRVVNCQQFPEEAKPALIAALNIWGSQLNSPQPVIVRACWRPLDYGTLAQAAPASFSRMAINQTQVFAPIAVANAINNRRINSTNSDINVIITSATPLAQGKPTSWHFDPYTLPPKGKYDLTSALLHELGHGFGFISAAGFNQAGALDWNNDTPFLYDSFLRDGRGFGLQNTLAYPRASAALAGAFTSNNIWFTGARASIANGNRFVRIFAPANFQSGSSITHLDLSTFKAPANRLMAPVSEPTGSRNLDPGPVALAMLQDMGWGLISNTRPPNAPALTSPSGTINTRAPAYNWRPVALATQYQLQVVDQTTDRVIFQSWISASAALCNTGVCSFSPGGAMSPGTYRWRMTSGDSTGNGSSSNYFNFIVR